MIGTSTLGLVLVLSCLIYIYFRRKLSYFSRLGIPHVKPLPILGNMGGPIFRREHFIQMVRRMYEADPKAKYVGFYNGMEPVILIRDPEITKSITIKDFDHFTDHRPFADPEVDMVFSKNIFSLKGETWRHMRNTMSPAFTSRKLKATFEVMIPCAENFVKYIDTLNPEDRREVNTKDLFTRFASDMVAAFAFGISVDSLQNPNNEFYLTGRNATNVDGMFGLKLTLARSLPQLMRLLKISLVSEKTKRFFTDTLGDTIKYRQVTGARRPDMLQMMMDNGMELEEIVAHSFGFFFAGFDTTSNQMCIICHFLAIMPEVHDRLQQEVDEVVRRKQGKRVTYGDIQSMDYLDAVIDESLRRHAQVPFLDRVCTKPYVLPPALPGLQPYVVRPGEMVWFSPLGTHMDPEIYENPEKFDPERFLGKKNYGMSDVTNLTFGVGPRSCIGIRFAKLEMKAVIFYIMTKYNIVKSPKTSDPLDYCATTFSPAPLKGFWAGFERRIK